MHDIQRRLLEELLFQVLDWCDVLGKLQPESQAPVVDIQVATGSIHFQHGAFFQRPSSRVHAGTFHLILLT